MNNEQKNEMAQEYAKDVPNHLKAFAMEDYIRGLTRGVAISDAELSLLRERVKSADDAKQLVEDLAAWSTKYPRSGIYPMSKMDMDDELIELENRAKAITSTLNK